MSKHLDGTSLFTGMNSGLTNTFAILSSTFKDGKLTADEVQDLTTNLTRNGMTLQQLYQLGTSSGMSSSLLDTVISHFNEIDKNKDGKVTNAEIQAYGVDSSVETQKKSDRNSMLKQMSTFYETAASDNDESLLDYKYLSEDSDK